MKFDESKTRDDIIDGISLLKKSSVFYPQNTKKKIFLFDADSNLRIKNT